MLSILLAYCDYGKGTSLYKLIGPSVNKYNYQKSFKIIAREKNKALSDLWNILKRGRSLRNDNDFTVIDGDFIGFWRKDELNYLKNELQSIRDNNDIGIEYIRRVLTEIEAHSEELIISSEV